MTDNTASLTENNRIFHLPDFSPDCPGEKRAADRMNRFYRALGAAAESYVNTANHIRRYSMEYAVDCDGENNGAIRVTVRISVRCTDGNTVFTRRRTLCQTWLNGRLTSYSSSDIY